MKKMLTTLASLACVLCTFIFSAAMTANASTDNLVSEIIDNGRTFIMSEDAEPIIDEDISSFVREMKELYYEAYAASTATRTIVDMNQPVEELKHTLDDSECISVTSGDYGVKLVTRKGNDEYVYNFDMYSWTHETSSNWIWVFQYENFEYKVFEENSKLAISKIAIPSDTIQNIDMSATIEELKYSLNDSECVSVTSVGYGAKLVTRKGNDEYVYNFDMFSWPHEKRENSWSWTFQYENFEYIVFENNSQLAITKIARPSDDAPSYNLILNYDEEYLSRFRNDLANCSDVHITTDMNFYPRVHVYIYKNDGTKVEYVLFYYNEKPLTEECEILGKVTAENELTFYYVDGFTCVDVAPLENIES